MPVLNEPETQQRTRPHHGGVHISLPGLIALCVALVLATVCAMEIAHAFRPGTSSSAEIDSPAPANLPPWGELTEVDVTLEQPEEYVAFDAMMEPDTVWNFTETDPEKVRALMLANGLTPEQATKALASSEPQPDGTGIKLRPNSDLVFSLTPEVRGKFYRLLAANPENRLMLHPYRISTGTLDSMFKDSGVDNSLIEVVRKLLYPSGKQECFSDLGLVLGMVPTEQTKIDLVKALTRQNAVLGRARIRPDTDIDKLLGYWASGSGARSKDVRPLLEAIKRLKDGGSVGIGYLLPPFARERLFTSPMPSKPGDVAEDCHWSSLNFFNSTPDDRFADPAYTSKYIDENYYPIARPSLLGDLVFLLNKQGEAIHSAVYIAGDLVFTKNGVNYAQPWILTHMAPLIATYSSLEEPKVVFYRRKNL